MLFLAICI